MTLPKRLSRIVAMTPPSGTVCDIGCDHAYAAISLIQEKRAAHVLACDIHEGPLSFARRNISREGLEDRIEVRLGDGLAPIEPGECETAVIAGMGGPLMVRILRGRLQEFHYLVLSPQSEQDAVRHFLLTEGMRIREEEMLTEDGKYYVILVAENPAYGGKVPGPDPEAQNWSEADFLYGKLLLDRQDTVLRAFLEKERARYEGILAHTEQAEVRIRYQHCREALLRYDTRAEKEKTEEKE